MITLLILAYNEEQFIKRTVLKYTNDFKEIVIVNDASKDKTLEISRELANKYENITIIQKGRPFQNPARPVLILQAKPITNIATRAMPKKIVIFSLNFINLI